MTESNQGPATPGTAARCEDDLDLIASALGLTPYQGSNSRTIHEAEEAVSRLRALIERARAETLNEAAKEVDLVAAEYIGQAGEAEFDPNWIAGESLQGAAERIRSLIPVADGAEGPRVAPTDVPEIERLKAENASLLESLRAAWNRRDAAEEFVCVVMRERDHAQQVELPAAHEALAAAEQRNTALEGALRDLFSIIRSDPDMSGVERLMFLGSPASRTAAMRKARAALHDEERPPPMSAEEVMAAMKTAKLSTRPPLVADEERSAPQAPVPDCGGCGLGGCAACDTAWRARTAAQGEEK